MPTGFNHLEALNFHLQHIAGLDSLLQSDRYSHIDDTVIALMMEQAERFSGESLIALAAEGDRQGCQLKDGQVVLPEGSTKAYRQWCELGFPALSIPEEQGGFGFPRVVQQVIQELQDGANLAFGMLCINQRCAAAALLASASTSQVETWLPLLLSGELAATIAISEPQAGSDVGRITSRATVNDDGSWHLSGTKFWISYGDHDATDNILHLVLARTGDSGTRGLSLFAVPKILDGQSNGVQVLRLEEKMGLHASPTCVLELENSEGYLIGEEGRGLASLFPMMNAMRLAVSVQGSAVANAATQHALQYAFERKQGGHPEKPAVAIGMHADVKRMLLEMTAKSELLRALSMRTASYLDLSESCADERSQQFKRFAELLLPVAKTLSAEWGFEVASQGVQVLGGYGYTNDFPLERMTRDIRVAAIYEGTSGIQALDFVKRKLLGDNLETIQVLLNIIENDLNANINAENPLRQPLLTMLKSYHILLKDLADGGLAVNESACAILRLSGLLFCAWNGAVLYGASEAGKTTYLQRLKQSLTWFSVGLSEDFDGLVNRARAGKFDFTLEND